KLLLDQGNDITLACLENSPIESHANSARVKTITFPSNAKNFKSLLLMINSLGKNNFDLIHSHYSKDLWLIVPALKILNLKIPLVLTKHLGSAVSKKDIFHHFIYKRLDHAIAISNVIKDNLLETTNLTPGKVSVIHNFIDLPKFKKQNMQSDLKHTFGIDQTALVLGLVGRITPGKGHEDIIEALRIIQNDNFNYKVIVAGTSSPDEKEFETKVKQMVNDYNMQDDFIFTGFRNDIPELLSIFDAFLFPSRAEAFGLALLEAMAAGVPSVACYSDGVKDIVIPEVTSLTYKRNDIETLAKQLHRIMSDKALRTYLAENSTGHARQFSASAFQDRTNRLYSKLLGSNPRMPVQAS
ncbi:MAG: glycosyltransferase family 4 protein, partial [Methanococcaceae archaeon]